MTKCILTFTRTLALSAVFGTYIMSTLFLKKITIKILMKNIPIYIAFTIILLGGCTARQVTDSPIHIIDFGEAIDSMEEIMLSKYVSALKYTPIETCYTGLLGNIGSRCAITDSLMFFASGDMLKCIHIFSSDGKYIKDIGAKGRGPNEYLGIRTMTYIPQMDALMVEGGFDILFYSLKDGNCIKKCNLNDYFDSSNDITTFFKGIKNISHNLSTRCVLLYNDTLYATAGENTTLDQYLIKLDRNFSVDTILSMRRTTLGLGMPKVEVSNVYQYNDNIYILHGLQDTVYRLKNNSLLPHIAFNYGNMLSISTMPQIQKTHPIFSPNTRHLSTKVAQIIASSNNIFAETDSFVIGTLFLPKDIAKSKGLERGTIYFVYDKNTESTKLIKQSYSQEVSGFTNDVDGGMPFWPSKQIGNKLYQFVDAGTFIDMSEKYNSARMKEIAATLTEESNPVIIEATLK